MRLNTLPLIAAIMVLVCAPETRADCTGPTGPEAQMLYNKDKSNMQYCNGTNWVGIARMGANITTGLVGHWKLDESSGSAADSSVNGNNGTLVNSPTWQPSGGIINGGALSLNGTNQYVQLPSAGALTFGLADPITVSAWIKLTAYRNDAVIIANGPQASPWNGFWFQADRAGNHKISGQFCSDLACATYIRADDTSDVLPLNSWHHVAVTYDGSNTANGMTVYKDGVAPTQTRLGGNVTGIGAVAAWRIGTDTSGTPVDYFNGLIDDVRIYNRALSADEINALSRYHNGDGACASPSGAGGSIIYNAVYRTLQFCDGVFWQNFGRIYTAWGATFDGTNDYLTRGADLTTSADSTIVTGSFWFRRNGGNGTLQVVYCAIDSAGSCRFQIDLNTANRIHVFGAGTGGGAVKLDMSGGTAITDTAWHHVAFSVDLTDTTKRFIYLDGVAEALTVTTFINAVIEFTRTDHSVGAFTNGASKFNGDLADFYLNIGTYIDLSIAVKREMFRDSSGNAVVLGNDGSRPTGGPPQVFLSDATLSTWPTNKGDGGEFNVNGSLAQSATQPGRSSCSGGVCTCVSPTANEGTMLYNGDHHVLQYCDGANWRGVGK